MDGNLLLSHRGDMTEYIVRKNLISNLKNYQVLALRFLFTCFRRKQSGAILSEDQDMNFEIQVSIFLKAITAKSRKTTPILILTPTKNLWSWHYHLHKYSGLEVKRISALNANLLFQRNEHFIILSDENDLKHLRNHRDQNFYIVVVDQLDAFTSRDLIKGDYNIGLTHINYLRTLDVKNLWKMIRWANPSSVGRETDFSLDYYACLGNFIPPHNKTWYRVTWDFDASFRRPTADEKDDLDRRISNFHMENSDSFQTVAKRTAKKREAPTKKPLFKPKKWKHNKVASPWSSEEEPVDVSVFIPTKSHSSPKKKFNFNDSSIESAETSFNTSTNSDDKDTSKTENSKDSSKHTENLNKTIENFNKRLNKSPALALTSQKRLRKHVTADFFEEEVLKIFEDDFVPHQKMRKNKSDSSLRRNTQKVIDKYVLEEFSREFNMDAVLEKSKRKTMEILGNVSSFFEDENDSWNNKELNSDLDSAMGNVLDNLDTSKEDKDLKEMEDTPKTENIWTTVINLMNAEAPVPNYLESNKEDDSANRVEHEITANILESKDKVEDTSKLKQTDVINLMNVEAPVPNILESKEDDDSVNRVEHEITASILESKDEVEDTSKLKQTDVINLTKDDEENWPESECILSCKSIENEESNLVNPIEASNEIISSDFEIENSSPKLVQNGEASLIESPPKSPNEDNSLLLNIIRGTVKPEHKICVINSPKEDILSTLFGKEEDNEILTRISPSKKTINYDVNDDDFFTNLFHSSDKNIAETEAVLGSLLVSKTESCSLKREENRRKILSSIFDDEDS